MDVEPIADGSYYSTNTGSIVVPAVARRPDIHSPSCAALQGAVLGQLDKVLIPSEPAPVALVLQSPVQ